MSSGISSYYDDKNEYIALCKRYELTPGIMDENYQFASLKARRRNEEILAKANEIKHNSGNNSDFRWTWSFLDEKVTKVDITKNTYTPAKLFNTRKEAIKSLKEHLFDRLRKIKKEHHDYITNEEKKIIKLEFKIDTLK